MISVIGSKFLMLYVRLHSLGFYCYLCPPLILSSENVEDSSSVCLMPQIIV